MPEIVIKYKDKRALNALMDFSKYFNFSILPQKSRPKENCLLINGVSVQLGDSSIDITDLEKIFSGKRYNAKSLRDTAWKRGK